MRITGILQKVKMDGSKTQHSLQISEALNVRDKRALSRSTHNHDSTVALAATVAVPLDW